MIEDVPSEKKLVVLTPPMTGVIDDHQGRGTVRCTISDEFCQCIVHLKPRSDFVVKLHLLDIVIELIPEDCRQSLHLERSARKSR